MTRTDKAVAVWEALQGCEECYDFREFHDMIGHACCCEEMYHVMDEIMKWEAEQYYPDHDEVDLDPR